MSDPSNIFAIDELKFLTQYNIEPVVAAENAIEEAIARYYDIGVRGVLIRGFDPYNDAIEFGRELIPCIRQRIAGREKAA